MYWTEEDSEQFGYVHLSAFLKSFLEDRNGQKHHKSSVASSTDDSPTSKEVLKPRIEAACPKISSEIEKKTGRNWDMALYRGFQKGLHLTQLPIQKLANIILQKEWLSCSQKSLCASFGDRIQSLKWRKLISVSPATFIEKMDAGKPPTSFLADSGPRGQ